MKSANYLANECFSLEQYIDFLNERLVYIEDTKNFVRLDTREFITYDALKLSAKNLSCSYKPDNSDKLITVKGVDTWLSSPYRRVITGQHIDNGEAIKDNSLNLFKGFGVLPIKNQEAVSHTLEYIKYICNSEDKANALIRILAWQVQNISEPSKVILLIKSSRQQVGKSTFFNLFMGRVWGQSAFAVNNIEHITSRFNAYMSGVKWICCEETGFAGSYKESNIIKDLATTNKQRIEIKGGGVFQIPAAFNLVMLTNQDTGAHIEEKDQRYFLIEIEHLESHDSFVRHWSNKAHAKDSVYASAFLHYLLNMQLPEDYRPADDLKYSDSKEAFVRHSNTSSFRNAIPEDRIIPFYYVVSKNGRNFVRVSYFKDIYKEHLGSAYNTKRESDKKISEVLKAEGFGETMTVKHEGSVIRVREVSPFWQIQPDTNTYNNYRLTIN